MVEIREIESLPGGRVRLILENGIRYTLLKSTLRERPLEVGQFVDEEEFADWVLKHQYRSALDKAVAMLAVRACSKGEIREKLQRIGYSAETIDMVLYKLESNQLVNDQEFADQWTQYRAGQNFGPRRIAMELRRKGISEEKAGAALEELTGEQMLNQAVLLARKGLRRAKEGEDPRKLRQRIFALLARRGYGWDLARQALETALKEQDETLEE